MKLEIFKQSREGRLTKMAEHVNHGPYYEFLNYGSYGLVFQNIVDLGAGNVQIILRDEEWSKEG